MSEMIERVGRALYEASLFRETAGEYEDQSEDYRRMCRLLARAALEAMRKPTARMKAAASLIPHARDGEIYTAMIDEALRDE